MRASVGLIAGSMWARGRRAQERREGGGRGGRRRFRRGGRLRGLAFLHDVHVMPGDAAADRAPDRVVAGIVTRDGARRPAGEATDRLRRRRVEQR